MADLQKELSSVILTLIPKDLDLTKETIPYMTLGTDNDWTEIFYGASTVSGDYIIEEMSDDEIPGAVYR
jgi:hypothetical protein